MALKRLTLLGLGLIGVFAIASATAQATVGPRWYLKETGGYIPLSGLSGLIEPMAQETLQSEGEISVVTNVKYSGLRSLSECLVKDRGSIEDPPNMELAGTGEMEEFGVVCEKESGGLNAAAPYPCVVGEPFELIGVGRWPSTLEREGSHKVFDNFGIVQIEVNCLATKEHAVYAGPLRVEFAVGRLRFLGAASGELEDTTNPGHRFTMKGTDFIVPVNYKEVRPEWRP